MLIAILWLYQTTSTPSTTPQTPTTDQQITPTLQTQLQATIHPDSTLTLNMTTGQWSAQQHIPFVNALQALFHSLQQHIPTTIQHVKAHNDHPWNEMADTLAKAVCSRQTTPFLPQIPTTVQSLHPDLQWLWLQQIHDSNAHTAQSYPQLSHDKITVHQPHNSYKK